MELSFRCHVFSPSFAAAASSANADDPAVKSAVRNSDGGLRAGGANPTCNLI
jgi:hypothetical protein